MIPYANLSGHSGVRAYQPGPDFVIVEFKQGRDTFYKYTYGSAGSQVVEHMKYLAEQGRGLHSFISKKPQPGHASSSSALVDLR